MRENIAQQPPLVACAIDHVHAAELARVGALLRSLRGAAARVGDDLRRGVGHPHLGRRGLSGEQVLRIVVLKQLTGFSYERLAFHLADSMTYRSFCGLGLCGWAPKASTLQANVKQVRAETLQWIHERLIKRAVAMGVEDGATLCVDSTVVETNIHHPNDSSLLRDGIREVARLLRRADAYVEVVWSDHGRRAKRRALKISNAKSMKARLPAYRDLLKICAKTLGYAESALDALKQATDPRAAVLIRPLETTADLLRRVYDQAERRVLGGENVPASEKVVSVFEPHTDILLKGGREPQYGHKVFVSTGRSGLVLDVTVERGNPPDSTRTIAAVQRHERVFGTVPREVSYDAGFASRANQSELLAMGVQEVAFAKNSAIDVMASVSSPAAHRALFRLRAGIEASISWLKRCFGLRRCPWSGFASFQSYTLGSVLAANLLQLARLTM